MCASACSGNRGAQPPRAPIEGQRLALSSVALGYSGLSMWPEPFGVLAAAQDIFECAALGSFCCLQPFLALLLIVERLAGKRLQALDEAGKVILVGSLAAILASHAPTAINEAQ